MKKQVGKIEAIYIADIAPKKSLPMVQISIAEVSATGIVGDRYESKKGSWKKEPEKRHITLIEKELIELANSLLPKPFGWHQTRRNLVVTGFPLNGLVGKRFAIGSAVVVEGTELCTPCNLPSVLAGIPGFAVAFEGRGGLRAKIIVPGVIKEGDEIRLVE